MKSFYFSARLILNQQGEKGGSAEYFCCVLFFFNLLTATSNDNVTLPCCREVGRWASYISGGAGASISRSRDRVNSVPVGSAE